MPHASIRRIAPSGSSFGSSTSRISTAFTSVMNAAFIEASPPRGSVRSPLALEVVDERLVGLVGTPTLADHSGERPRDRLRRLVHEDVAPDRAADRTSLDGDLHPPEQLG